MSRQINNPYKMNWKGYGTITVGSILAIICTVWIDKQYGSIATDVLKNLAFGFVASTLVAVFIEMGNIKEKNEKANHMYDAVYSNLIWNIEWYLQNWARFCKVSFKDREYSKEEHTWTEWYELTRDNLLACDESRQRSLFLFYQKTLIYDIEVILAAIAQIESQQYLLEMNEIYDGKLKTILSDFRFEFTVAKDTLERDFDINEFTKDFDSIEGDLIRYLNNWDDIRAFNNEKFKPYY